MIGGLGLHRTEVPDRLCFPSLSNKSSAFLFPHPMMGATYASETTTAFTSVVVVHDPACTTISPLGRTRQVTSERV